MDPGNVAKKKTSNLILETDALPGTSFAATLEGIVWRDSPPMTSEVSHENQ